MSRPCVICVVLALTSGGAASAGAGRAETVEVFVQVGPSATRDFTVALSALSPGADRAADRVTLDVIEMRPEIGAPYYVAQGRVTFATGRRYRLSIAGLQLPAAQRFSMRVLVPGNHFVRIGDERREHFTAAVPPASVVVQVEPARGAPDAGAEGQKAGPHSPLVPVRATSASRPCTRTSLRERVQVAAR